MLQDYLTTDNLTASLSALLSLKVNQISKLDLDIYRIDFETKSCVARVYHGDNCHLTTSALSKLLDYLAIHKFPAEELAPDLPPVVEIDTNGKSCSVLLTKFVHGAKPERGKATFYKLGDLLGRLHSLPTTNDMVNGGAWHHLSLIGGLEEECNAVIELLESKDDSKEDIEQLCEAVRKVREITQLDLPNCLIHPDFVPSNVIAPEDGEWVVVDWTGAGIGLRVLSLGFLLGVGAIRGKIGLVNVIMKSYGSKIALEPEEVKVMHKAAYARFLTILAWEVGVGRKKAKDALNDLPIFIKMGEDVGRTVKEIMSKNT